MEKKPVILIILDGLGIRHEKEGNGVLLANTPTLDYLWDKYPHNYLKASGRDVGLPDGQMGNSEVGHTNIGAGRVVYQSLTRIDKAIEDKELEKNKELLNLFTYIKKQKTSLHLVGLLSDGGVHSHLDHLFELLKVAKLNNIPVYIDVILDGRDVAPKSGLQYIKKLQEKIEEFKHGEISSISGRYYAMDRDNRWDRIKKYYDIIIHGRGKQVSKDEIKKIIELNYENGITDEFIEPMSVSTCKNSTIKNNDGILFFNFRPDRALQISKALSQPRGWKEFDRGELLKGVKLVTMTPYSNELDVPTLFNALHIDNVLGEVLEKNGSKQLRIAETEKYPHVTFFFNGRSDIQFNNESRILVKSPDVATYDLKPEMSIYELTDKLLSEIKTNNYEVIILNFANPDMVGHSGKIKPTVKAIESVDICLGLIVEAILEKQGVAVITADHGNAETLVDDNGNPHTAHTTVPVPIIITKANILIRENGKLADIAPTILDILNIEKPKEMTGVSLINN